MIKMNESLIQECVAEPIVQREKCKIVLYQITHFTIVNKFIKGDGFSEEKIAKLLHSALLISAL